MKKNSFVGWLASHVMLALVVLVQLVVPVYSLKADICNGYFGVYHYRYDPVPEGYGDWTYSNCAINGTSTKSSSGHYFWTSAGTESFDPWKNYILISFSYTNIVSGTVTSYRTAPTGPWELVSTYAFTNYSGSFGVSMYHFNDCFNGYKLKLTIDGSNFSPEIERWANN